MTSQKYVNIATFCLLALLITANLFAASNSQNVKLFEKILTEWTYAFNHKDLSGSCDLFDKHVVAHYQGAPEKNYMLICNGFKKVFSDPNKNYQYRFKLHNVYRAPRLAAIRLTWYLTIYADGKKVSQVQDEGLDVFQQDSKGAWKIINYLAYPLS